MKTLFTIFIFIISISNLFGQHESWLLSNLQGSWIEQQDTLNKLIIKEDNWIIVDKDNQRQSYTFKIDNEIIPGTGTGPGSIPIVNYKIVLYSDNNDTFIKYHFQDHFEKDRFVLGDMKDISKQKSYRRVINNR